MRSDLDPISQVASDEEEPPRTGYPRSGKADLAPKRRPLHSFSLIKCVRIFFSIPPSDFPATGVPSRAPRRLAERQLWPRDGRVERGILRQRYMTFSDGGARLDACVAQ